MITKKILTILIFISAKSYSQDSVAFKTVAHDLGANLYTVQSSTDQKTWVTLTTFQPKRLPDSNNYSYPISAVKMYYRIVPTMINGGDYTTIPLLYTVGNSATITNLRFSHSWWYDNLSWVGSNEINLSFYLIERSANRGVTWSADTSTVAKGSGNYSLSAYRLFGKKPLYRISPVFTDGTKGSAINF